MTRYLVGSCVLAGLMGIFSGCERDAVSSPHLAIPEGGAALSQPIQPSIDEHPFVHADPRQVVGGVGGAFGSGGSGGTAITGGSGGTGGTTAGTGATGGTGGATGGAAGTLPR